MTKRAFLIAGLFSLAGMILPAVPAAAQPFGVGGQMPGSYGYGSYGGFYPGANYGGYGGYGYGGFGGYGGYGGYGNGGYGGFPGYGGYSGYYQQGGLYGYGSYGAYPNVGGANYYGGYAGSVLAPKTSSYSSSYPTIPNIIVSSKLDKPNPGVTTVIVKVPNADAEVWFGNVKTKQTGLQREFVTPALEPGKSYKYEVRASWIDNKVTGEHKQTISFIAGQPVVVDFTPKGLTEKPEEKKTEKEK